jgi:hypothetical protein
MNYDDAFARATISDQTPTMSRSAKRSCDGSCLSAMQIWSTVQCRTLSPHDRFYNRYFWAKRFAAQYQAKYGFDAGVEQQVFKLLETAAELDLDWTVLDKLDRRAQES